MPKYQCIYCKKCNIPLQIERGYTATSYEEYIYQPNELKSVIDKGYYDYDYEENARKYAKSNKPQRTEQQQKAILQRFGFGNVKTVQEVIEQVQAQRQ